MKGISNLALAGRNLHQWKDPSYEPLFAQGCFARSYVDIVLATGASVPDPNLEAG